ncbi:hypothetical protein ACFX2A_023912 [Malus domestica]
MLCCFCSTSLGSVYGFTAVRLGILLHSTLPEPRICYGVRAASHEHVFLSKPRALRMQNAYHLMPPRQGSSQVLCLLTYVIKYCFWYVMVLRSFSSALAPTSSSRMLAATSSSNI